MIEAHALEKSFQGRRAIEGVSFSVSRGEVFGLLGPNGAGKTTTLRILSGLFAPDAGSASVAGFSIKPHCNSDPELRRRVGLLTEHPGFYDRLSARYNLVHFGRLYGLTAHDAETRARALLSRFGLSSHEEAAFAALSRGMRQKLAIARAILHKPDVLFLDEPTVGLDPEATREVRSTIEGLAAESATIVLCTHHLDEVERLCSRAAFIAGRTIGVHEIKPLSARDRRFTIELFTLDDRMVSTVSSLPCAHAVRADGRSLQIEVHAEEDIPDVVAAVVHAGGRVRSVTPAHDPLEEAYLALLSRARMEGRTV